MSRGSLPVIVIGGGGHASVVINTLRKSGYLILGLLDPQLMKGTKEFGVSVLGDDEDIVNFSPDEVMLSSGVGYMPGNEIRKSVSEKFKDRGFKFLSFCDPNAIVADDAEIAEGAQIFAGAIIQPGVQIGAHSIINTGSIIEHDSTIGSFSHVAPGAVICGGVEVGESTFIGAGSVVIQGIKIGNNSVIAAGVVVSNDVSSRSKVKKS
jgi:sugar O-acyltransferase (sialic acid O-acetyltransferase NeuD family)